MARILVTGGAGFIGSHLVDHLLAGGDEVVVLDDLSTGRAENLAHISSHARLRMISGSIVDSQLVSQACEGVEEVYHLAAAVGVALVASRPIDAIERNIEPTRQLLEELCRRRALGQVVKLFLASTSEVYGKNPKAIWREEDDLVFGPTTKPRWSYGMSKAIDEFLALGRAKTDNLPVVVGRFFNVVGPRQTGAYGMVLPRFVSAALANKPLMVHGDGSQTRCFAHVRDVVKAITTLMATPSAMGRVFNIGSDQPITILELARQVIVQTRSQSKIEFQTYVDAFGNDFEDVLHRVPDVSRLRAAIGSWQFGSLDSIIRDVANSLT
jgi:UDP-glucose 4-epimerase